jgi:hypothetical protein
MDCWSISNESIPGDRPDFASNGDRTVFEQLRSLLVEFTPDFEIMPGTQPVKAPISLEKDVFEQPEPASTSGG